MNVFEKGDVIEYHIMVWLMLTINDRFEKSKNNPSLHSRETVCNFFSRDICAICSFICAPWLAWSFTQYAI